MTLLTVMAVEVLMGVAECRGMCRSAPGFHSVMYRNGWRACIRCRKCFKEYSWCPCCSCRLRTRGRHDKKFRDVVARIA